MKRRKHDSTFEDVSLAYWAWFLNVTKRWKNASASAVIWWWCDAMSFIRVVSVKKKYAIPLDAVLIKITHIIKYKCPNKMYTRPISIASKWVSKRVSFTDSPSVQSSRSSVCSYCPFRGPLKPSSFTPYSPYSLYFPYSPCSPYSDTTGSPA